MPSCIHPTAGPTIYDVQRCDVTQYLAVCGARINIHPTGLRSTMSNDVCMTSPNGNAYNSVARENIDLLHGPTIYDVQRCVTSPNAYNSLYSARKHLPHGPTIYDVQRCVHDVTRSMPSCIHPTGLRSTMSNDV